MLKQCRYCGKLFITPKNDHHLYCSPECSRLNHNKLNRKYRRLKAGVSITTKTWKKHYLIDSINYK